MEKKPTYKPESPLTLDEMLDYADGKLDAATRERIARYLEENPLYQAAMEEIHQSSAREREQARAYEQAFEQEIAGQASRLQAGGLLSRLGRFLRQAPAKLSREWLPRRISRRPAWAVAVGVLLLLVVVVYVLQQPGAPPDEAQLYAQYLEHYVDPLTSLSGEEAQALQYYHEQNYQEAIPLFEQIILKDEDQQALNKIKMFLSVSLMRSGREAEAIPYLQQIIGHGQSLYVPAAKWYLALAYLKEHERAKTLALLEELAQQTPQNRQAAYYQRKAEELLKKLR